MGIKILAAVAIDKIAYIAYNVIKTVFKGKAN